MATGSEESVLGGENAHNSDSDWEDLSRIIHKFVPGEPLEGVVAGSEVFAEGKYAGKSRKWFLVQSDGVRVSFVAGEGFDKLMVARKVVNGDHVRITLLGQKILPDGRKCNEWQLLRRRSSPVSEHDRGTPF